ncbi:TPA: hypothetical protein ACHIXG_000772 [Escherichia coli]|uniref:hypothetical protein n=1 Tax=Escherichia coli TaxID=562 RepID=UPI00201A9815|nr:hypothetical protein [Escherichia coli]
MALVHCRHCRMQIPAGQQKCPYCGHNAPEGVGCVEWCINIIKLAVFLGLTIWWFWPDSEKDGQEDTQNATQEQKNICKNNDFECLSSKYEREAIYQCKKLIINAASGKPYEFHGGFMGEIFDTYSYKNDNPIIRYIGDKVTFTNDFGVKIKMKYECAFNTSTNKIESFNIYRPAE